jgi:hypothetical protein
MERPLVTRTRARATLALVVVVLIAPSPARAADEPLPPPRRVVLNNLFVVRTNPVGLEDQLRLGYQQRLYDHDSRVLRDNFFFAGIYPRFNPAFIKIGPSLEIQPISMFNLRVAAEYVGFFSSFGQLQSFASALDRYSDRALDAGEEAGLAYAANGFHLVIEPLLQAKIGPFALRNKLAFEYWYVGIHNGDRTFYDITLDTLVPQNGWVLANDLDLLYLNAKYRFVVGVRYSAVKPLYGNQHFRPGEDPDREDNDHQRIGPLLAYTFFDRGTFGRFDKPTLVLMMSWYVDHRYRTGREDTALLPGVFVGSRGIPYLVLAFAFQSDLLTARKH